MQNLGSGSFVSGISLRQAAVIAGLAYLLNPVTYAEFHAMPRLVADSGMQTVANIAASASARRGGAVLFLLLAG
jgi:hypothetical protein